MPSNISCMSEVLEFHAQAKLLVTGEYLVLAGATALALPLRFGQRLRVEETGRGTIDWESSAPRGIWFRARFSGDASCVISADDPGTAGKLRKILSAARELNPGFLEGKQGFNIKVRADYPLEWGLGSSSSLCHLVAGWAGVDPLDLHIRISNGSGYDVAAAGQPGIFYYRVQQGRPQITPSLAGPALRENALFVFLGNKQDTAREVAAFLARKNFSEADVERISELSSLVCLAGTGEDLCRLADEHESVLGDILDREPIARRFPSFPGTVKSLGAWGGDFAMFVSPREQAEVVQLLHQMGFPVVFTYDDLKLAS